MRVGFRAFVSSFLGFVGSSFITVDMIVGTAYGLVIAAVLFVVFTYGSPPRELKTISFELSYTFGLASVGGLLSLVVFWQLTGGFPAEHRYFWPGTVTIIILTVGAGYVLSPGRASLDRS